MNVLETLKKEWYVLIILLLPFISSAVLWNNIPDIVPTHFNIQGEADDYGPKWMTAIMFPAIGLGVYFLLLFLPVIDPKNRIRSTQKPISAIRIFTSVFFTGIYAVVMAKTLGYSVDISIYVFASVGLLFMVLGNYMNSVKPNYFVGIRTPWTLENPEVWRRTHRMANKVWIAGGLLLIIIPLTMDLTYTPFLIVSLLILLGGVPLVYSYLIFKKITSSKEKES